MTEVLGFAADGFRVIVAGIFALVPGIAFWLAVIGLLLIIQWVSQAPLYQIAQNKIRESLKPVTRKVARNRD
jgi:UPF0716 family protein affecting phage T7 exclusion